MSLEALQRIALLHGITAWIAVAALILAAAALLRRGASPPALRLAAVAAALIAIAGAQGALLEEGYRSRLRQKLFLQAPDLGWLFERKLHLAFAAIVLASGGLGALWAARSGDPASRDDLARAAKIAATASAALALAAAVASVIVARHARF